MRKFAFALVLIAAVFLTGCFENRYDVYVKDDGTCTFTVYHTMSAEVYQTISREIGSEVSDQGVIPEFQEYANFFESAGFTIEPIRDMSTVGFRAEKSYPNVGDMCKEINNMYKAENLGLRILIRKNSNLFGDTWEAKGTVRLLPDPAESFAQNDKDIQEFLENKKNFNGEETPPELLKKFEEARAVLNLRLPGNPSETSGTHENGKFVFVHKPESVPTDFTASSKINSSMGQMLTIAGGVVLVLGGLFFGTRYLKQRKKKNG